MKLFPFYLLGLTVVLLCACTHTKSTVKTTKKAHDPLGGILQQLEQEQQQIERQDPRYPKGIPAVSTFALFAKSRLLTAQESNQDAFDQSIKQGMKHLKIPHNWHKKILSRFSLVTLPVNSELPINLSVLSSVSHPNHNLIKQAKDVIFIRYKGNALYQNKHLNLLCKGLEDIAQQFQKSHQNEWVLAHLNTLQILDQEGIQRLCHSMFSQWIKPAVELLPNEQVRFVSRGLAQLGQADLESNPMSKSEAPKHLRTFQVDMQKILEHNKPLQVGEQWGKKRLKKCNRADYMYDLECVQINYE